MISAIPHHRESPVPQAHPSGSCRSTADQHARGKWFFLGTFIFACFLFWWLPSILFRVIVHQADAVQDETIVISIFALVLFIAGYLLPVSNPSRSGISEPMLDACESFAYRAAILLFIPSLIIAVDLWRSHVGVDYGSATPIPRPYQAVLYTHLFFGFLYLGAANPEKQGWRRISTVVFLVILPRLIESLHGGRFFLAQAVVPAVLIGIGRGWIRLSAKRMAQFAVLALFIIFVPSLTRGDDVKGQDGRIRFFAAGSSLRLYQENTGLSLSGRCPPLLVSFTAKIIPYGLLGVCVVDIGGLKNMPATLDRILTINDPSTFDGTVSGTGSNYLLDLYLFGGIFVVFAGSALFGFSCRRFVSWIGRRSLFSGIWAECLTRSLLAPRGSLGYVYERIPSLVLTTLLVVLVVAAGGLLKREYARANQEARIPT
jgi:hypothetical protein